MASNKNQKHLIHRPTFEIEVEDRQQSHRISNEISQLFYKDVLEELEKVLDEFSTPRQLIRFKKLEIDLGYVEPKYLKEVLLKELPRKLRQLLAEKFTRHHLHQPSFFSTKKSQPFIWTETEGRKYVSAEIIAEQTGASVESIEEEDRVQAISIHKAKTTTLMWFLEKGRLPDWAVLEEGQTIQELLEELVKEEPLALVKHLQKAILQNYVARRLAQQFLSTHLQQLIQLANINTASTFEPIFSIIKKIETQQQIAFPLQKSEEQVYEIVLQKVFSNDFQKREKQLVEETLTDFLDLYVVDIPQKKDFIKKEVAAIFKQEKREKTAEKKSPKTDKTNIPPKVKINAIMWFLEKGRLPDWSPIEKGEEVQDLMDELITEQPKMLIEELEKRIKSPKVLERLQQQFSTQQLDELIQISVATKPSSTISLAAILKPEKEKPLFKEEESPQQDSLQKDIAQKQATTTLTKEQEIIPPFVVPHHQTDASPNSEQVAQLDLLYAILSSGQRPWWATGPKDEPLDQLFLQLLQQQPEKTKTVFQDLFKAKHQKWTTIEHLLEKLSYPALEQLTAALAPQLAGFMITQTMAIERLSSAQVIRLPNPKINEPKDIAYAISLSWWWEKDQAPKDANAFLAFTITQLAQYGFLKIKPLIQTFQHIAQKAVQEGLNRFSPLVMFLRMADDGRWTVDGRRQTVDGGRPTADGEEQVVDKRSGVGEMEEKTGKADEVISSSEVRGQAAKKEEIGSKELEQSESLSELDTQQKKVETQELLTPSETIHQPPKMPEMENMEVAENTSTEFPFDKEKTEWDSDLHPVPDNISTSIEEKEALSSSDRNIEPLAEQQKDKVIETDASLVADEASTPLEEKENPSLEQIKQVSKKEEKKGEDIDDKKQDMVEGKDPSILERKKTDTIDKKDITKEPALPATSPILPLEQKESSSSQKGDEKNLKDATETTISEEKRSQDKKNPEQDSQAKISPTDFLSKEREVEDEQKQAKSPLSKQQEPFVKEQEIIEKKEAKEEDFAKREEEKVRLKNEAEKIPKISDKKEKIAKNEKIVEKESLTIPTQKEASSPIVKKDIIDVDTKDTGEKQKHQTTVEEDTKIKEELQEASELDASTNVGTKEDITIGAISEEKETNLAIPFPEDKKLEAEELELIPYFLQYGSLPASTDYNLADFETLIQRVLIQQPRKMISWLQQYKKAWLNHKAIAEFSDDFVKAVMAILMPKQFERIISLFSSLREMHSFEAKALRLFTLEYGTRVKEANVDTLSYLKDFIRYLVRTERNEATGFLEKAIEELKVLSEKSAVQKDIEEHLIALQKTISTRPPAPPIKKAAKQEATPAETTSYPLYRKKGEILSESLYVSNAGLVLLWPFLSTYFQRLTLMNPLRKFKGEEQQMRAVHLLQYLATKHAKTPEHDLVLNKLLCGLDIETPLPLQIEMTQEEIEMSESLLRAVVNQWTALKNTSPDGLRGGFLIRDGRLTQISEKKWLVRVNQKPFDILLLKIPWSYGMIRLAWTNYIINVEWR